MQSWQSESVRSNSSIVNYHNQDSLIWFFPFYFCLFRLDDWQDSERPKFLPNMNFFAFTFNYHQHQRTNQTNCWLRKHEIIIIIKFPIYSFDVVRSSIECAHQKCISPGLQSVIYGDISRNDNLPFIFVISNAKKCFFVLCCQKH